MYPRQEDALPQNCPQRLVRSWSFEAFFAVAIEPGPLSGTLLGIPILRIK